MRARQRRSVRDRVGTQRATRLDFAILAHAAEITDDGLLAVLGGDFDTIRAPDFPAIRPVMALVIKLALSPKAIEREHRIRITLTDSNGVLIQPEVGGVFTPAGPRYPDPAHQGGNGDDIREHGVSLGGAV